MGKGASGVKSGNLRVLVSGREAGDILHHKTTATFSSATGHWSGSASLTVEEDCKSGSG